MIRSFLSCFRWVCLLRVVLWSLTLVMWVQLEVMSRAVTRCISNESTLVKTLLCDDTHSRVNPLPSIRTLTHNRTHLKTNTPAEIKLTVS